MVVTTRLGVIGRRPAAAARWALAGLALLLAEGAPQRADAFVVVSKSPKVSSDAVRVVALREGSHTVLSIEARVRGPASEVALLAVTPPAVGPIATTKLASLEPVSRVTGPRLAEYWEQDPCEFHDVPFASDGTFDAAATESGTAPLATDGGPEFTTEVSPAKTGAELVASLKHDGYGVPDPLAAVLDEYLKAGSSVVIARLDTSKLPRRADAVILPPLRIHYLADELTLPTRLFAVGGQAAPDGGAFGARRELSIDVLSPGVRYEAANQPNVAVPTNLSVPDSARSALPTFYRFLLDGAFDKIPGAIVTEYAWRASTCEVCAGPLTATDVDAIGAALLPSAGAGKQDEVLIEASAVSSRPDGPAETRAALMDCYGKAVAAHPGLAGTVAFAVEVGGDGAITTATPSTASQQPSGPPDDALLKCADASVRSSKQWRPGAKGALTVTFAPLSRAFLADLVLTALRGRYDAIPEHDLRLVPGRAIEGGREMGTEGSAPARVYPAQAGNDFQARYVIRHPYAGAIECASPTRGVWSASPPDGGRATLDRVRPSDAGAPGSDAGLAQASVVDFSAFAIHFGPPAPSAPAASTASPSSPRPVPSVSAAASTTDPPPHAHADCGACSVGSSSDGARGGAWVALAAVGLFRVRRRVRTLAVDHLAR